MSIEICL